jgi:hypothetical protein
MEYNYQQAMQILERTPRVLHVLLSGLDDEWLMNNEGPETFSPYDVVGHLVHGEHTDWTARIKKILEKGADQPFDKFDRFAMYNASKGKSIDDLLAAFKQKRKENLEWFTGLQLQESDLDKTGMHPGLGVVTLRNLLSTWVIHDLTHLAQISRVMAKQLKKDMGPWTEYFRLLNF